MPKINTFSLFLIVVESLSFTFSPIHRKRLEFRFKLDDNSRGNSRISISVMDLENENEESEKNFEVFEYDKDIENDPKIRLQI